MSGGMSQQSAIFGIQSTAGAVPIRNEKGELSMKKVKVQRYISGKRPEYAHEPSSEYESEDDDFIDRKQTQKYQKADGSGFGGKIGHTFNNDYSINADDPRLRRLARNFADEENTLTGEDAGGNQLNFNKSSIEQQRIAARHQRRHIHEPEFVDSDKESDDDSDGDNDDDDDGDVNKQRQHRLSNMVPSNVKISIDGERQKINDRDDDDDDDDDAANSNDDQEINKEVQQSRRRIAIGSDSDGGSDTELSDSENEKRRQRIRQKTFANRNDEEALPIEDEKQSESSDSESSEYEEETGSEEENEPRLKPLFVRKRDRATIAEKEKEAAKQRQLEYEAKRLAKERRRQTLRLVEETIKKEMETAKITENGEANLNDVCTDDENDEIEYETWKLRELKRIKRDRDEREQVEKERTDVDRLRNLTEEERRQELRLNPKQITNKATKGKYKFLQKYYHRGAFYLNEEADVFKRDFAQATLEDHFDKTILPKVMQVKNFGRCGRTKYTHLVDQDTTQFDSPWYSDNTNNIKFHSEKAGGMKQVFERPALSKRKKYN